jgi:hypothetical protein
MAVEATYCIPFIFLYSCEAKQSIHFMHRFYIVIVYVYDNSFFINLPFTARKQQANKLIHNNSGQLAPFCFNYFEDSTTYR